MSNTELRDIGSLVTVQRAIANTSLTAAGTGDNTAVVGAIHDRAAIGSPQSAVLAIPFTATLAATATLTISGTVEHAEAANMSGAATLQTISATVVATGPAGGGTVTGCLEVSVPLMGARRHLRANITPDLSAGGTDTAAVSGVFVFGGATRLPQ
jgi:hypothetical protein